jgi:hypothetical protein
MAAELVYRVGYWWQLVACLVWVLQTLVHYVMIVMSACNILFVDLRVFPLNVLGRIDVRREILQRRFAALFMIPLMGS